MPSIRFGVQLHPQHTSYQSFADAVRQVEALGIDSIWNWDHFFLLYGPTNGALFEGMDAADCHGDTDESC
jgi:alkanesulfonate monooxygenase SsuD/methylene tetrahydromethanopterin reductase-like flavin-dependent oxidoreductase (luciferase family)